MCIYILNDFIYLFFLANIISCYMIIARVRRMEHFSLLYNWAN